MGYVLTRDIAMCNSKVCFKCSVEKPLYEFYKHKMMADGHVNKCKECNKSDVRRNRADKIDYYLEYDKQRADLPRRVEARKMYSQTTQGKRSRQRGNSKWRANNIIKRSAHIIVGNYLRDGKLKKPDNCETCGDEKVRLHGHHDDYAYPLSVRWLCPKCHSLWHKENREILQGI